MLCNVNFTTFLYTAPEKIVESTAESKAECGAYFTVVHYIRTSSFIFQIILNKNTIISNSRHKMFPKFTYIGYNLMLFRTVLLHVSRLGLN